MQKQISYVSYVLENGHLFIGTSNYPLLAMVDKINSKIPTSKELKDCSGKNIHYEIMRQIAKRTILIQIISNFKV